MELFSTLETILQIGEPEEKCRVFDNFYKDYHLGNFTEDHKSPIKSFPTPSYQKLLDLVLPSKVKSRRKLYTKEGQASLLHAIIHIEYSAIDLALDHAYRFRDLPKEYYSDWLEVANDEVRHFRMLMKLLREIGYNYGDFPVHDSLFLASKKSENSLFLRMGVVPRYLEASGLDSNPMIIEKLKSHNTPFTKKIEEALKIILQEEVDHVRKGDKWFNFASERDGVDRECYFHAVKKIYPKAFESKKSINREARKEAGFSERELEIASGEVAIPNSNSCPF